MPVFAPLQMELLAQRPADIRQFCVEWLKKYSKYGWMQMIGTRIGRR